MLSEKAAGKIAFGALSIATPTIRTMMVTAICMIALTLSFKAGDPGAAVAGGFPVTGPVRYTRGVDAAARLLERIFAPVGVPLAFRLWDGTTVHAGARGEAGFAVVFHSPRVLRRCLRHPSSLAFGEAYIDGDLDIEGDLFAAMESAAPIEHLQVPLRTRLAALATLLRL